MRMGVQERANAVRILRDGRQQLLGAPMEARLRYAVSLIVCGPDGGFALYEVEAGMNDPRIRALADTLMLEAGAR